MVVVFEGVKIKSLSRAYGVQMTTRAISFREPPVSPLSSEPANARFAILKNTTEKSEGELQADTSIELYFSRISSTGFITEAPKEMPLSSLSILRITEEMNLEKDFIFHDKNAIVLIEQNLNGLGKKISIAARNVIVCPKATLRAGELDVRTEGSALLLNVTADVVRLATQGDAVLGNSCITSTEVNSEKNATVFGINQHDTIPLEDHFEAIVSVLEDLISPEIHSYLPNISRLSGSLLEDLETHDATAEESGFLLS